MIAQGEYPRWKILRGCLNKKRYETRAKAQKVVRQQGRGYGRPYQCIYGCGGWHLGHYD